MDQMHKILDNILLNAIKLYAGVHGVYPPKSQITKWKNRLGHNWVLTYRS